MKETYLLKPLQTLLVLGLMFTLTNCGNLDNPLEELSGSGGSGGSSTVSVTSITLDPTTLTINVGDAPVTLTATVKPDDATDKTVTWTSDKESVATVDETGKITAVDAGTATITATAKDGSGVEATCVVTVLPEGALAGVFFVSSTKKVQFSRGNLQATYDGSSWTWAFAENQWDYIGNAEGNTKVNDSAPFVAGYTGSSTTVDLFGWVGASSSWTDVNQYGITTSTATNAEDGYGDTAGESLKSDWGTNMGTGWRTLTSDEWVWLLGPRYSTPNPGTNCRAGSTVTITPTPQPNARWAYATINTDETGVNGIIMFPDGLTIEESEATSWGNINKANSSWNNSTKCTTAQWNALEAKGCVFLPAAGSRTTTINNPGIFGYYWSSTGHSSTIARAYFLQFTETDWDPQNGNNRNYGRSVRLVRDVVE